MRVMGMTGRIDLLDVNVWLALSASEHPNYDSARAYWGNTAAERLAFCRITMLGLLRLMTNVTVMGGVPLSVSEAWTAYAAWRAMPEVAVAREPEGCEALLAGWAGRDESSGRQWTDAYLAAFARSGGMRLVSFDRDFEQFDDLDLLLLTSSRAP